VTDAALRRADQLLTDLVELVETARAVPMSTSCVVPREHILDLLDELRDVLPPEMDEARKLAAQRDTILRDASEQAEALRSEAVQAAAGAHAEAGVQAEAILSAAQEHAAQLHAQADEHLREVLTGSQAQADALIADARAEHERLVTATGVHQAAATLSARLHEDAEAYAAQTRDEADRYTAQTRAEAERYAAGLRADASTYAERTLADLVGVLTRAVTTTEQGRQELQRRRAEAH
jgi:cell division septum initiation protein DivIVA